MEVNLNIIWYWQNEAYYGPNGREAEILAHPKEEFKKNE